jgi:hypothetical protein
VSSMGKQAFGVEFLSLIWVAGSILRSFPLVEVIVDVMCCICKNIELGSPAVDLFAELMRSVTVHA